MNTPMSLSPRAVLAQHMLLAASMLVITIMITSTTASPRSKAHGTVENAVVPISDRDLSTAAECYAQDTLVCRLSGTRGNSGVSGSVMMYPAFWKNREGMKCGVRIRAFVLGLKPGKHGFHAHTYGDERSDDASLAGGHFVNPANWPAPHNLPTAWPRHWGDFGNIEARTDGKAFYDKTDFLIRLPRMAGRSVIIHAGEDKGPSEQPSGDSGPRVAQCIIGIANPEGPRT